MQDERSIKFVALFHITSDWFEIGEPDHIATAQFWPVDSIRASLELTPCQFTPTFRRLFEFFSRLRPT